MGRTNAYQSGLALLTITLALATPVAAGTLSVYTSPFGTDPSSASSFTPNDDKGANGIHSIVFDAQLNLNSPPVSYLGTSFLTADALNGISFIDGTGLGSANQTDQTGEANVPGGKAFVTKKATTVPEPSEYMGFIFAALLAVVAGQRWLQMKSEADDFVSSQKL